MELEVRSPARGSPIGARSLVPVDGEDPFRQLAAPPMSGAEGRERMAGSMVGSGRPRRRRNGDSGELQFARAVAAGEVPRLDLL